MAEVTGPGCLVIEGKFLALAELLDGVADSVEVGWHNVAVWGGDNFVEVAGAVKAQAEGTALLGVPEGVFHLVAVAPNEGAAV